MLSRFQPTTSSEESLAFTVVKIQKESFNGVE